MSKQLKPRVCPWCWVPPDVEPWHGGGPMQHMVSCSNDYCHVTPSVTGPTKRQAIDRWNGYREQKP